MPNKEGWDDVKRTNVDKIVQILNGSAVSYAESSIKKSGQKSPAAETIEEESFDDLFDFDDDDEKK
jgi:hypothetical protein